MPVPSSDGGFDFKLFLLDFIVCKDTGGREVMLRIAANDPGASKELLIGKNLAAIAALIFNSSRGTPEQRTACCAFANALGGADKFYTSECLTEAYGEARAACKEEEELWSDQTRETLELIERFYREAHQNLARMEFSRR